jgi:hypothetical protein
LSAVLTVGFGIAAPAQVITVNTKTGTITNGSETVNTVDRRYQQIAPTNVPLSPTVLNAKTRIELVRALQSEQGFAMRPFPCGHKGLTLAANGKLEPYGEAYLAMVTKEGLSTKPGDRLVLSDVKFEHNRIIFDLNGGPDHKHRFLRHVQVGTGNNTTAVTRDDEKEATGSRLTLTFPDHVPELTSAEIKALLAPLISFDLKTPIQAFTDTLPEQLKEAILNHKVLVGMTTEMLLYAKGQPTNKTREMEGQMPIEEWIYGTPPKDVEFVRINGNRVIRLEVARTGESLQVYTKDEVSGLMRSDGTSVVNIEANKTRTVSLGDTVRDPDTQAPAAPPTLRKSGEKLPEDGTAGAMKPVRFPKEKTEEKTDTKTDSQTTQPTTTTQPGANPDEEPAAKP